MEKLFIEIGVMFVEVKIVNRRKLMGRKQFEVVPVAGFVKESKWVNEDSLLKSVNLKKFLK